MNPGLAYVAMSLAADMIGDKSITLVPWSTGVGTVIMIKPALLSALAGFVVAVQSPGRCLLLSNTALTAFGAQSYPMELYSGRLAMALNSGAPT